MSSALLILAIVLLLLSVVYKCRCNETAQCNPCLFKCNQTLDVCYRDCHDDDMCIRRCYGDKAKCYMKCLDSIEKCCGKR